MRYQRVEVFKKEIFYEEEQALTMAGTKLFFIACLIFSGLIVVILMGQDMTPDEVPAEVAAGYELWQKRDCAGCHTLYGQGGDFAPDLTHIYEMRGESYLNEFLVNPPAFHPGERLMPRFGFTRDERTQMVSFLAWANNHDSAENFPPRQIAISGSGGLSAGVSVAQSSGDSAEDPAVTRGHTTFTQRCASCHSLTPDQAGLPGPAMYGIADRAWYRIPGVGPEAYIRNSIVNPGDYIVEGFANVMQSNFGEMLSSDDINDLVAFLMTLEDPEAGS